MWYFEYDIADEGLLECIEGGRLPDPTLLVYELLETLRVEAEDEGRKDEIEDANELSRVAPLPDVARNAFDGSLVPGGAGAALPGSPARSTRVLRLRELPGGGIAVERALVSDADISNSLLPGVGI